ncbi:hypothetical protein OC845_000657 [Tilletia horrida]|nr:hypothetical protein OC845_000657 [Tilletia horrida]
MSSAEEQELVDTYPASAHMDPRDSSFRPGSTQCLLQASSANYLDGKMKDYPIR